MNKILWMAALAAFGMTAVSQAAVVINVSDSGTANAYTGDIANGDLVNAGQATLLSVDGGNPYTGNAAWAHGAAGLNDGGANTTSTDTVGQESTFYWQNGTTTIQFDLDTTANTAGYDLTDINVYSGWPGDAENNQYTVQYSLVGSDTYVDLATANYTTDVASRLVTITDDAAGVIASGVDSIRFNLTEAEPWCVINEIDVLGSATVIPESAPSYEQDFTDPVTSVAGATLTFGAGQQVDYGEFGNGQNIPWWEGATFTSGSEGKMSIGTILMGSRNVRDQAVTLLLDTSTWAAGDYTATFDVADYTANAGLSRFSVYEGNIDGALSLTLAGSDIGGYAPFESGSTGTVSFDEIGSGISISANGQVSYNFTLTDAGSTGDYVLLGWGTRDTNATGGEGDTFSVDNITVGPAAVVVQSNTVYSAADQLSVSSTDLVNFGQATLDSLTVSDNRQPDESPDRGSIDGTASDAFAAMTWFRDDDPNNQLPATLTFNLDVTANTAGYDISEITSFAGFGVGTQGQQVITVEYSVIGNAGFTALGSYSNETPGDAEFGSINLAADTDDYLLGGVDALRFTYGELTGTDRIIIQEIDVMGVASAIVLPPVQLELASMFSDDMILQREKAVPVWGTSDPGAAITVEFAGQTQTTTAAGDGTWRVDLESMVASAVSRSLTVTAELEGFETEGVSFSNVLVGEVWICSGQSNMQWPLFKSSSGSAAVAAATHPTLRLFYVPTGDAISPLERIDAVWTECTPEAAGLTYAVAYYFGCKLQAELDVPVGLIQSAYGGSKIEKWFPDTGGHYNAMIAAQIPFAMRGAIWYQGESDVTDGMLYVEKKKQLVNGWRALWGEEFPFYYVQIAPYVSYDDGVLPYFWEAQSAILDEITNTGMAVVTDTVANLGRIHPYNKEGPGTRLALLALDNTYGQDIVSTGPVFQSLKTVGNTLEVTFDSAEGLTTSDGLAPDWFELEVADGVYTSATAVVSNNMVILSAPAVTVPTGMRFAWSKIAQPNLRNSDGLVASSFRVDGAYNFWGAHFGLSGSNALHSANPDGDALDNLAEYALGGNPTNGADRGYVPLFGTSEENGTNYFEYVYARRRDAASRNLKYTVKTTTNLVSGSWSTNDVTETACEAIDSDFESVTNRVPLGAEGYIRLIIESVE